ncbi:hypothetical protein FACS1894200_14400 [Spirochaetia bacterium]|nr:hypothetical protein FACS1894200_14400 [Spirochaetia bacterium]
MVEQNKERRLELMQQLQGDIERNFLPVRTLPTTPRKFHISNKCQLNLKPSF